MLQMEKAAERQAKIDCKVPHFKHKVHKTVKDYRRQPKHRNNKNSEP